MANSFEESTHGLLAGGDFAAAAGADPRAWIRHRLFPRYRNSHGSLHRGRHRLGAEHAGNAGGKLRSDAYSADADSSVCPAGRMDVFVGTEVHAEWGGDAHPGGMVGSGGTDGVLDDSCFNTRVAEDSSAGER